MNLFHGIMGIFTFAPKAAGGNKKGLFSTPRLLVTCKFQGLFCLPYILRRKQLSHSSDSISQRPSFSFRYGDKKYDKIE